MIDTGIPAIADGLKTVLTGEEREIMKGCVRALPPLVPAGLDDDRTFTTVGVARREVPARLAATLIDFRRNSNAYGTLLIRNLPADDNLPPTPANGRWALSHTSTSAYNLLLLMSFLGEPIAYADEKDGMVIQNIVPVPGYENAQENTGSSFLDFHTEDGFHPHKPDYLGLLCLRADHDRSAVTATASIRRALPQLATQVIDLLREPVYQIGLCASFLNSNRHAAGPALIPVLRGDRLEPEMCVDFHAMRATTRDADHALATLKQALIDVRVGEVLLPGDMLIIDNRVCAHARTGFQPAYGPDSRWLQRLFVVEDFRRSQEARPHRSHVCRPLAR